MHERRQIDRRDEYLRLGYWLQQVMAAKSASAVDSHLPNDENGEYHPHFYQQLPDFVMALLKREPQVTLHYAPLLYHMVGCAACHDAYLDLYGALRAAMQTDEVPHHVDQRTSTLEATPVRMVVQLCQSFIHQAEALYYQSRREHTDASALARSLLQQALHISARIKQGNMRSRALMDLVRVANLFDDSSESLKQGPATYSYSLVPGGGSRGRAMRRVETTMHSMGNPARQDVIYLQSNLLRGSITQNGDTLELHLRDLDKTLCGQYLTISVPLGSLIEPIRWIGGNPRIIRGIVPVDEHGTLSTPLGQTELRLNNSEERNLLEAIFLLLEVRTAA